MVAKGMVVLWLYILISIVTADYCTQNDQCPCYKTQVSYNRCGVFGLRQCSSYRAVLQNCTCTKEVCCPGYEGPDCNTPLCFGSTTCPNNGTCVSPNNCLCQDGFMSPACNDIDECVSSESNESECEQICVNIPGSYECSCEPGYILDEDGKSCNAKSMDTLSPSVILRFKSLNVSRLDEFIKNVNITSGSELFQSVQAMIKQFLQTYTKAKLSIKMRLARTLIARKLSSKIPGIMAVFNVSFNGKGVDGIEPVRDRLVRGLADLLKWKTLAISPVEKLTAQAKLDMPEAMASVCDVFSMLGGSCGNGLQCSDDGAGPLCREIRSTEDANSKVSVPFEASWSSHPVRDEIHWAPLQSLNRREYWLFVQEAVIEQNLLIIVIVVIALGIMAAMVIIYIRNKNSYYLDAPPKYKQLDEKKENNKYGSVGKD